MVVGFIFVLNQAGFTEEMVQPRKLVDAHTAGILPQKTFSVECHVYPNGRAPDTTVSAEYGYPGSGVTLGVAVGVFTWLNLGISYGGDGIIGRNGIRPNPHVGGMIKIRVLEETYYLPALAFGVDNQGYGGIAQGYIGYINKSPGVFIATSKNYLLFTKLQIGLHGEVNYSFEDWEKYRWPDCFVGLDLGFTDNFAVAAEYDVGLLDNDLNPLHGYLNLGFRWALNARFYIEFDAKDILQQRRVESTGERLGWSRELKFSYVQPF